MDSLLQRHGALPGRKVMPYMSRKNRFRVLDPRKGQEWTTKFYDGSVFSNLDHQCMVLHIADHRYVFDQRFPPALMLDCLRNTGMHGLFTIAAVEHIEDYDVARIPATLDHRTIGNSIVGQFDVSLENVEGILNAMQVNNQYCYELNLASCLPAAEELVRDPLGDLDYTFLLRNFCCFGALASFDYDNLEIIMFLRLSGGCDDLIDAILRTQELGA